MKKFIFVLIWLPVLFCQCSKEIQKIVYKEPEITYPAEWHTAKVAVILPMNDGMDRQWKAVTSYFQNRLQYAFANNHEAVATGMKLEVEYYDENSSELESICSDLAKREDIVAVVGGRFSNHATLMASVFSKRNKPFFTFATTESLIRGYSSWGNLWAMVESDITQCEVMLSRAALYGSRRVALLTYGEEDPYSKTFVDWFSFQTQELGLENMGVYEYHSGNLEAMAGELAASETECVICAPSSVEDILTIQKAFYQQRKEHGTAPRIIYSDIAYDADMPVKLGAYAEGLEGIAYGSFPDSGFDFLFEQHSGLQTTTGSAQYFDALMLICYAEYICYLIKGTSFKDAMKLVVGGRDYDFTKYNNDDQWYCYQSYALRASLPDKYGLPDVHGASGSLNFDEKVFTNVLSTTYQDFIYYNGRFTVVDHISTEGSQHSDATLAAWNWKLKTDPNKFSEDIDIKYPVLDDRWALLVAASTGWENYRHQADVYSMYQILRRAGYPDDHIVFIAEDDIANNLQNRTPDTIQVRVGGENVYSGVSSAIDYHLSDLNPSDIDSILCGRQSARLHDVIHSDSNDNVVVFWSGHGIKGSCVWNDRAADGFNYQTARQTLIDANRAKCYRKMLWLIETCYSGSIGCAAEGLPGILAFTAANDNETSKADVFNVEQNIWMSNRFTATLQDCIINEPDISLRDFYYKLYTNTVGSHACVFNDKGYGNFYTNNLAEFFSATKNLF